MVTLYDVMREQAGRIDVLVANVGLGVIAPLGTTTEEHFDTIFAVNVKSIVFTVQKAMPLLSRGASVILLGSSTSRRRTPARRCTEPARQQ